MFQQPHDDLSADPPSRALECVTGRSPGSRPLSDSAFPSMHGMVSGRMDADGHLQLRGQLRRWADTPAPRSRFTSGLGGTDDIANKHSGTIRASRERVPGIAAKYSKLAIPSELREIARQLLLEFREVA